MMRRGSIGRLTLVACLAAAVRCLWSWSSTAFSMPVQAPSVLVRPRGAAAAAPPQTDKRAATDVEEMDDEELAWHLRGNSSDLNITLQLSDGHPGSEDPSVIQGPRWANCFVEYEDRKSRDAEGSIRPKAVLEEWVVRGEREHIHAFKSWRQGRGPSNVRCIPVPMKSIEDVTCLECVAPGRMQLSPTGHFSSEGSSDALAQERFIMTVAGLPQCLRASVGGTGFCRSGTVTMPM
mmetsp:Transcript_31800/g.69533  ORF Transcript_31800/g.69533 Transcript_31800/m.69533 type:complete len:235 (-) Transcript_31800:82-786(-)